MPVKLPEGINSEEEVKGRPESFFVLELFYKTCFQQKIIFSFSVRVPVSLGYPPGQWHCLCDLPATGELRLPRSKYRLLGFSKVQGREN